MDALTDADGRPQLRIRNGEDTSMTIGDRPMVNDLSYRPWEVSAAAIAALLKELSSPPSLRVEVIAMPEIRTVAVQQETPASPREVTAKEWITDEARRLKRLDKIPVGITKSRGGKTEFAILLEANMKAAARTDHSISISPVGWEYIRNHLQEWALWPIADIKLPDPPEDQSQE